MKKPVTPAKRGRPEKFKGGSAVVNTAFRPEALEDLKRFTAYLTSIDGVRRSYGDVLTEALMALPSFQAWKKRQKML